MHPCEKYILCLLTCFDYSIRQQREVSPCLHHLMKHLHTNQQAVMEPLGWHPVLF